jgi:hypothetical protein
MPDKEMAKAFDEARKMARPRLQKRVSTKT